MMAMMVRPIARKVFWICEVQGQIRCFFCFSFKIQAGEELTQETTAPIFAVVCCLFVYLMVVDCWMWVCDARLVVGAALVCCVCVGEKASSTETNGWDLYVCIRVLVYWLPCSSLVLSHLTHHITYRKKQVSGVSGR